MARRDDLLRIEDVIVLDEITVWVPESDDKPVADRVSVDISGLGRTEAGSDPERIECRLARLLNFVATLGVFRFLPSGQHDFAGVVDLIHEEAAPVTWTSVESVHVELIEPVVLADVFVPETTSSLVCVQGRHKYNSLVMGNGAERHCSRLSLQRESRCCFFR